MIHFENFRLNFLRRQRIWEVLVTVLLTAVAGLAVLVTSRISLTFLGLFMLAVIALATVAVVGDPRKLMLILVIADVAVGLDQSLFLIPNHEGGAQGIELTLTVMIIIPYFYLQVAESRRHHKHPNFPPGLALSLPTVGIILASTLSMLAAADLRFSVFALARLFQFLLLYAYVVQNIQSKKDLDFYISVVMFVVLAESLLIILQYFTQFSFAFAGVQTTVVTATGGANTGLRPGGTLGAPNEASAYLVPHLMLILGVLMSRPIALQKYLGIGTVIAGLVALVITQTRTGWITIAVVGVLMVILALYRRYVKFSTVFFLACIMLLLAVSFSGFVINRIVADDSGSAASRLPMMVVAENMVRANPILGVGVNNYAVVMDEYPGLSKVEDFDYVVHNRYWFVWAETGTLGLICLGWFVVVWLRQAYYAYRLNDLHLSPTALGVMMALAASLINWTTESLAGRQDEQAIWMMAALAAAIYGLAWQRRSSSADEIRNAKTLINSVSNGFQGG